MQIRTNTNLCHFFAPLNSLFYFFKLHFVPSLYLSFLQKCTVNFLVLRASLPFLKNGTRELEENLKVEMLSRKMLCGAKETCRYSSTGAWPWGTSWTSHMSIRLMHLNCQRVQIYLFIFFIWNRGSLSVKEEKWYSTAAEVSTVSSLFTPPWFVLFNFGSVTCLRVCMESQEHRVGEEKKKTRKRNANAYNL